MKKVNRATAALLSLLIAGTFSGCSLESFLSNTSQNGQSNSEWRDSSFNSMEGEQGGINDDSSSESNFDSSEENKDEIQPEKPKEEAAEGSVAWYLENGYKALFNDPYMKNGISVFSVDGSQQKAFQFATSVGNPSWQVAQWHSRYDLHDYESLKHIKQGTAFELSSYGAKGADGKYLSAKTINVDTSGPSLYLELNAELEFDKPKEDGEGWPHILISQDFSENLVRVCEREELTTRMEYTITHCDDRMNGQANPSKHCAQLVWYVTLQNRNPDSEGYGQYIWFGFNLWDNRHSGGVCPEYAAQDLGKEDATLAFIYQPSSRVFFKEKRMPFVGEKVTMDFDFLSTAKSAFLLAKERGYLPQTVWEDVYIGSMNFGWEVTGIYNVGVQIDTVGIYYK